MRLLAGWGHRVGVKVGVGVNVRVGVGVFVGVSVIVGVSLGVGEKIGVGVSAAVGVAAGARNGKTEAQALAESREAKPTRSRAARIECFILTCSCFVYG